MRPIVKLISGFLKRSSSRFNFSVMWLDVAGCGRGCCRVDFGVDLGSCRGSGPLFRRGHGQALCGVGSAESSGIRPSPFGNPLEPVGLWGDSAMRRGPVDDEVDESSCFGQGFILPIGVLPKEG